VAAAALGGLAAAAQLLPFLQELRIATIVGDRAAAHAGAFHLQLSSVLSWFSPNATGNPELDGRLGPLPNYAEATGFATITMLALVPIGAVRLWMSGRSRAVALIVLGLVAAAMVYTPFASVTGRLPLLDVTGNTRMLLALCFVVSALGALGVQAVWDRG